MFARLLGEKRIGNGRDISSDGSLAALVGTNAHRLPKRHDEDLAIADFVRSCGIHDYIDGLGYQVIGHGDFDLCLGKKINRIFAAAVDLGVAFLAAETLHLGNRHTLDADP